MPAHQAECPINVDLLKRLLLDMSLERRVDGVLKLVVDRLASQPEVALVRIWLMRPGDICDECPMRQQCPDQTACLHLAASAGQSLSGQSWERLDGDFRRFPIGVRKVGQVAKSGQPLEVCDLDKSAESLARPEWAKAERIRALGGQPLVYQGEVLGVLAVFTRACLGEENFIWLRMISDHAAAAIATARAFEEIGQLKQQLEMERDYLRDEVREAKALGDIVGQSPALQNILQQIELVAPTDAGVLILGESGTGKELVAREIHAQSQRSQRTLVTVNCASIPRELYESEFFGHAKGAFTGAVNDRVGRFELADGGTLFLDEVGEIPIELQSKLLRALQQGDFERVGEDRTRHSDARIVAATNRDLKKEVAAGRFREDLYYRLNVFPVEVPPLRQRRDDIPLLAAHFLSLAVARLNRPAPRLTRANTEQLQRYDWPGNIRELQNVIERAVITATGGRLRFDLQDETSGASTPEGEKHMTDGTESIIHPDDEMQRRQRANIVAALEASAWKVAGENGAARLLGLKPTTLASRIKSMDIRRPLADR
ncbi:MAG: sigma 54-interacting transcriptional regulator [Planctomycetes bacterium]|nr:sigma 54-interacting transcriptional regulator [Planctomycetota bacterium]